MNDHDLQETIDWLKEWIFRMEDRPDYDALKTSIDKLKEMVRELEGKIEELDG